MPNPLSHAAQPLSHLVSQPLEGSVTPDPSTGVAYNTSTAEEIAGEGTTPTSTSPPFLPLPPLLRLPPELLSLILSHVPAQQYQRTALALHKVFPTHGLAEEHLWRHIIVRRGEQLQPLWKAARVRRDAARSKMDDQDAERAAWNRARKRRGEDGGSREDSEEESEEDEEDEVDDERRLRLGKRLGTASFAMESWRGDADLLNNALRCLPHVPVMRLNLGTNFAPEHLEEMFEDPRLGMERLEMRFKPYVEQASYYQFLKGSYFDSAIETLTRNWPEVPSFTRLSIVQDLPPRSTAPPTAAHSMAASAMTSAAVSASASALASAATSVAASAVTSPATKPTELEDKVQALSLSNSTGTANDNGNGNGGGDGHDDGSSTSDGEASDYSTPPTSASDSPVVEVKGYTGHGPFPYLSDKIGWAKPKHFAQPIVFFDINCLAKFGASPAARHLTHLRLRVPSRNIAAVLCGPANGNVQLFPALKYLDISTTNVRLDSTLSMLLKKYECLEHLVLDRVNLFGFQARDKGLELCRELGGTTLSACLARGKERERAIAHWDTAERARIARAQAEAAQRSNGNAPTSSAQGTDAEGSLIDQAQREAQAAAEERERQLAIARSRRGHRSAAHSTFSLRDRPSRLRPFGAAAAATTSTGAPIGPLPPSDSLYLVLPPLPALRTLAIGGEALHVSTGKVREWTNEFHAGWREGLGKIAGWAGHVGERYERAKKKADEWVAQESRSTLRNSGGGNTAGGKGKHGKGKAASSASSASSSSASKTAAPSRPPTDVRLYRFPTSGERDAFLASTGKVPLHNPEDPTEGLIEIHPSTLPGGGLSREYLESYKLAIADAEVHANDYSQPAPCVLCTIPDCEGPRRRGDEGGRVDGRGGMDGAHVRGCGHVVGRETWGWNGASSEVTLTEGQLANHLHTRGRVAA